MPSPLLALPAEIISEIAEATHRDDLPNLRSSCRTLCSVANRSFAVVHFTERMVFFVDYSLETLIKITEHQLFGPYIKTITFHPALPSNIDDGESFLQPFRPLLVLAYAKIRQSCGSISISICEYTHHKLSLLTDDDEHWRKRHRISYSEYWLATDNVLNLAVTTADEAGCQIKDLNLRLSCGDPRSYEARHINKALDECIRSRPANNMYNIRLLSETFAITYHHTDSRLELFRHDFNHGPMCRTDWYWNHAWLDTIKLGDWITTLHVSELEIHHCHVEDLHFLQPFLLLPSIKSIVIQDTCTKTGTNLDKNLWSEILEQISGLTKLESCHLHGLQYSVVVRTNSFEETLRLIPEANWQWAHMDFEVAFADGESTFDTHGPDVAAQVKSASIFAAETEAGRRTEALEFERKNAAHPPS